MLFTLRTWSFILFTGSQVFLWQVNLTLIIFDVPSSEHIFQYQLVRIKNAINSYLEGTRWRRPNLRVVDATGAQHNTPTDYAVRRRARTTQQC